MGGYSYTIIRPGQLFGGIHDNKYVGHEVGLCSLCPFANSDTRLFWLYVLLRSYYLGTLFRLDEDAATQDLEVAKGDELLGDTLRSTLAEVTAQICEGGYMPGTWTLPA